MNEKLDNQLNLALSASDTELDATYDLWTGYNESDGIWELIVKYTGDISSVAQAVNASYETLLGGYAIVRIEGSLIGVFSSYPEIIYIEKPRRLRFSDIGSGELCDGSALMPNPGLDGEGVIVVVLDSGIDILHKEFLDERGKSRVIEYFNQIDNVIYSNEKINALVESNSIPTNMTDISGHGTAVASIMAGSSIGIASKADIIVVKLGSDDYFTTASLMRGINYSVECAIRNRKPIVINISIGNSYGAHNGGSLLESYIDEISGMWKTCVVVGTGNEGTKRGHYKGNMNNGAVVELVVGDYETNISFQLWKNYGDIADLYITLPDGSVMGPYDGNEQIIKKQYQNMKIYILIASPTPYNSIQEIYVEIVANSQYIQAGIWQVTFAQKKIISGEYHMWLTTGMLNSEATGFVNAMPENTLTIPSTSKKAISVGAYDEYNLKFADFSGRGNTTFSINNKPDFLAPGVDVIAASSGGGYVRKTGTSFAAPYVSGIAARLMQWGIVLQNDEYMYGEKVKARMVSSTVALAGEKRPSAKQGFGIICIDF